jgi:hypothetical protein
MRFHLMSSIVFLAFAACASPQDRQTMAFNAMVKTIPGPRSIELQPPNDLVAPTRAPLLDNSALKPLAPIAMVQDRLAATQRAIFEQEKVEKAECFAKMPRGEITKLRILVLCGMTARIKALSAAGYPYMDLEYLMGDEKVAIAAQLDAHQITDQEATILSRDVEARINSEALRRAREEGVALADKEARIARQVGQAQVQADDARRAALIGLGTGLLTPTSVGPSQSSMPTMTNCRWIGSQFQCLTQ